MCRLVVHPYAKGIVCLWFDQGIKKRNSPIFLITFDCELYIWIYTIDMIQEKLPMGLLLDDPSVIHKPVPISRWVRGRPEHSSLKCSIYRLAITGFTSDPIPMVVMDRKECQEKVENLLASAAYKPIPADPTNKVKAQLIQKLRRLKRETNMDEGMYRTMYPTGCTAPKFYGLPKIHKMGTP